MRLIRLAISAHLRTQWSSQFNFWSGVLGMLVNNFMILVGVWAMLFAGKEQFLQERNNFFIMNFVLMFSWGVLHVFFGGITNLDQQIHKGFLDISLTHPRSPLLSMALTQSYLPAWGDVILGGVGLAVFAYQLGWMFFIGALIMTISSFVALFAIYVLIGSLAFWFRRTETAYSMLVNMFLAFNTYPVIDGSVLSLRWTTFLIPLLLIGAIPSTYLQQPSVEVFLIEVVGSILLVLISYGVFRMGLLRYKSTAGIQFERS
ncbi:MAG TPA: ABC-2 family transporter protein [Pseudobdellovibrionaceae bacterium]|nr:ABC-2 family transporter protein [Pseudobdellovibrionaceae bacterium]